jgi:DNA-binding response OmpR family regulator
MSAPQPTNDIPTAPLRVLIVEDSPRIRDRIEEALREIDSTAIAASAETEADAVAMIDREPWDLVLLDLQLRQGNGLGVLKAVRAGVRKMRGTIAVFTGYAFPQYRARALELGADYFFDKAREFPGLLALMARLAGSRPAQRIGV